MKLMVKGRVLEKCQWMISFASGVPGTGPAVLWKINSSSDVYKLQPEGMPDSRNLLLGIADSIKASKETNEQKASVNLFIYALL